MLSGCTVLMPRCVCLSHAGWKLQPCVLRCVENSTTQRTSQLLRPQYEWGLRGRSVRDPPTTTHTDSLTPTHKHTCLYVLKSPCGYCYFDTSKYIQLWLMYIMLHNKPWNMHLYIVLDPKVTCLLYVLITCMNK